MTDADLYTEKTKVILGTAVRQGREEDKMENEIKKGGERRSL